MAKCNLRYTHAHAQDIMLIIMLINASEFNAGNIYI